MTKLVCIDNYNHSLALTLHKVYECHKYIEGNPIIIDDIGRRNIFFAKRFITLADWRDKQIDNILNDD